MNLIQKRICALREEMAKRNIDYVYVVTSDCHQSEYVDDHFKAREFISGFTGSNGDVLIGKDVAILWTDGRYYIQAEKELFDTEIKLYHFGEKEYPSIYEIIKDLNESNISIAVDFKTLSTNQGKKLQECCNEKSYSLIDLDLIDLIWKNRPSLTANEVKEVPLSISGLSRGNKLYNIRNEMDALQTDAYVLSSLDEIMWLMNIRGNDIECCSMALSYSIIFKDNAYLYLQESGYDEKMVKRLEYEGIIIRPYHTFYDELANLNGLRIALDPTRSNYKIYNILNSKNNVSLKGNNIQLYKAIKNKTEIANMKKAHHKDAIAMIKFLLFLETCEGETEYSLSEKLLEFRKQQSNFIEPSFETITGFLGNGAIVHYAPKKETALKIDKDGLLLIDSGGQYREGTTDITRTVVRGKISHSMKKDFTLVLKGHLKLMNARFIHGCTGANLDILARESLWRDGKNYLHGTGHGVGHCLSVHEGPHGISYNRRDNVSIVPGMIVSNEPGYYLKGNYGIRHENLMVCVKDKETRDGHFYRFENLTLVPFDRRGILKNILTSEEIQLLNDYHQRVYDELESELNIEEKRFLRKMTRPL